MKILRRHTYSDVEVVIGLQARNEAIERWFYNKASNYFEQHFNQMFFDKTRRDEIFQDTFLRLWTEITNLRIKAENKSILRMKRNGEFVTLDCSLTTFLMAISRNAYREVVRDNGKEISTEVFTDDMFQEVEFDVIPTEEKPEQIKARIVDECIAQMSPHCIDILTLSLYKGMSLDEIMRARADTCTSKNGLKTAKNKCMSTLKERVRERFYKLNLN